MKKIISISICLIVLISIFYMGCIEENNNGHKKKKTEEFPFVDKGMENITLKDVAWKYDGKYALLIGWFFVETTSAAILLFDGNNFSYIPTNITMKYDNEIYRLESRMGLLESVAWSPDGEYALIVGRGGVFLKYDGKNLHGISGISYDYDLRDISWNPKDSCFYIIGNDVGYPYPGALWKYDDNKITMITNNLGTKLTSIAWNPDGNYALITSMRDDNLWKYDGHDYTSIPYEFRNVVFDISWKPDGSYALIVGDDIVVKYSEEKFKIYEKDEIGTSIECFKVGWRPDGSLATIIGEYGEIIEFNGTSFINKFLDNNFEFQGIDWNLKSDYAIIVGNLYGYYGKALILKYTSDGTIVEIPIF